MLSRPGCHLCDDARVVVFNVLDELSSTPGERSFTELNIDEDAELRARYSEEVPVVLIDGKVHNFWHIDADRLRAALMAAP